MDRSGRSRHVRRRGACSVAVSVDPLKGTVGNVFPPAHTFTRAPKTIWKGRKQWITFTKSKLNWDIISCHNVSFAVNVYLKSRLGFWVLSGVKIKKGL